MIVLHHLEIYIADGTEVEGTFGTATLPASLFSNNAEEDTGLFFTAYERNVLLPLSNESRNLTTNDSFLAIGSPVFGVIVVPGEFSNLLQPVSLCLSLNEYNQEVSCCIVTHTI